MTQRYLSTARAMTFLVVAALVLTTTVAALVLGRGSHPPHTYSKWDALRLLGLATKGDASLILVRQPRAMPVAETTNA